MALITNKVPSGGKSCPLTMSRLCVGLLPRAEDLSAICGPDFQPFAVADGQLVTGQNPASSARAAEPAMAAAK
jgi:hypothetical protein